MIYKIIFNLIFYHIKHSNDVSELISDEQLDEIRLKFLFRVKIINLKSIVTYKNINIRM